LGNLETLETSGEQDTEGRQNIGQSTDTRNIRRTRHRGKTKHWTNLETLETSGTQDTDVGQRKHNRHTRDTGNIRNTRQRNKTKKAQLTIQRQWKHQEHKTQK
jgi:hypothetical protein